MNAAILTLLCGLVLVVLGLGANRIRKPLATLIWLQVLFWGISFVAVPAVMLWLKPQPRYGDGLANTLLASQGYNVGLTEVLKLVLAGLSFYALLTWLLAVRERKTVATSGAILPLLSGVILVAAGITFRLLWLTGLDGPVILSLLPLGTVGAGAWIVFGDRSARAAVWMTAVCVVTEVGWSVLFASKTPLIALFVSLCIRWFWKPMPGLRRRLLVAALCSVVGFLAIQGVKTAQSTETDLASASMAYPRFVRPILPILVRFDLIDATTDAAFVRPGSWLDPREALRRAEDQFLPRPFLPGKDQLSPGELWSRELRPISTGYTPDDVPLAEGSIAEGFALRGYTGLLLEVMFLFGLTWTAGRFLASQLGFVRLWGVAVITQPILFERGFFGLLSGWSEGLQVTVVAYALLAIARTAQRSNRTLWMQQDGELVSLGPTAPA